MAEDAKADQVGEVLACGRTAPDQHLGMAVGISLYLNSEPWTLEASWLNATQSWTCTDSKCISKDLTFAYHTEAFIAATSSIPDIKGSAAAHREERAASQLPYSKPPRPPWLLHLGLRPVKVDSVGPGDDKEVDSVAANPLCWR